MHSIALLLNTGSGQGDAERVEELLIEHGAEVECFDVREPEKAAGSGAERLAVAGGDGSIGFAAEAATATGIPVAVIATGTANDFAGQLGLPCELDAACRLAATGVELRCLDLARAGSRPFVNVAGVGLAPTAAEHADGLKDRLGALAYPVGAAQAGALAEPIECRVHCDGEVVHEGEAWQVSVASSGAFGGGASLEADASDGELDLVVIEAGSRIRLVKHAYGLKLGSIEGQEGVIDVRCHTIELELPSDESLSIDGELVEAAELVEDGAIRFRVEGDAFELVVG